MDAAKDGGDSGISKPKTNVLAKALLKGFQKTAHHAKLPDLAFVFQSFKAKDEGSGSAEISIRLGSKYFQGSVR